MRRHLVRSALLALALALPAASVAGAATPSGPRLGVARLSYDPARMTLITVGPRGGSPVRIAGGQEDGPLSPILLTRLAWRPDGSEVAFTGIGSIFLAEAGGGGAQELNIAAAERPVFSPDERTLVFTRFGNGEREAATWTIDMSSGVQRQLTPTRTGLFYVGSSFSPDGKTLLMTRIVRDRRPELVARNMDTGGITPVLRDGIAPVYSPDGSKVAFFREIGRRGLSDLFVLDLAKGSLRRLTRTPHENEIFASWDPSGSRLAFARFRGFHYEWANSVVQINADGSCEETILSQPRTVYYGPAWQPGAGRGAGPIRC